MIYSFSVHVISYKKSNIAIWSNLNKQGSNKAYINQNLLQGMKAKNTKASSQQDF